MPNITRELIEYLFFKASRITPGIRDKAFACLEDYRTVTAAGAAGNREKWGRMLSSLPRGNAYIIGCGIKTDGRTAALINGFNAHSLELDDGQRFAMIHLGASIISALNSAECENIITPESFSTGIIMGYEAACRIAIAMQPSHKNRGYHTAGTCGTIGSAVGVAFALGMNKAQLGRVITCAAGSAAGMLEIQEQQSDLKPYNLGRAAADGLSAAYMGLTGFETPDDMLGGERGFFRIFSDDFSPAKLTEKTDYFEIERIYTKPYASCRHSHSAVEAAIILHRGLNTDDIVRAEVLTYRLGVKGHDHRDIRSASSAKLSTPYAVAAALLYGRADLSVFDPPDEKVCALAQKIKVSEVPALTAECPQKRIAVVNLTMKGGETLSQRIDYAKGEPENPMTDKDFEEKRKMLLEYTKKKTENGI